MEVIDEKVISQLQDIYQDESEDLPQNLKEFPSINIENKPGPCTYNLSLAGSKRDAIECEKQADDDGLVEIASVIIGESPHENHWAEGKPREESLQLPNHLDAHEETFDKLSKASYGDGGNTLGTCLRKETVTTAPISHSRPVDTNSECSSTASEKQYPNYQGFVGARQYVVNKLNPSLRNNFLFKYSPIVMNMMKKAFVVSSNWRTQSNLSHVDPINTVLTCRKWLLAGWTIRYVIATSCSVARSLEEHPLLAGEVWLRACREIRCVASFLTSGRDLSQIGRYLHWARSKYCPLNQLRPQGTSQEVPDLDSYSSPGTDVIDKVLSMAVNIMFFSNISRKFKGQGMTKDEKIFLYKAGSLLTLQHYLRCMVETRQFFSPLCLDNANIKLANVLAHFLVGAYIQGDGDKRATSVSRLSAALDCLPPTLLSQHAQGVYPVAVTKLLRLFADLMMLSTAEVSSFILAFGRGENTPVGQSQHTMGSFSSRGEGGVHQGLPGATHCAPPQSSQLQSDVEQWPQHSSVKHSVTSHLPPHPSHHSTPSPPVIDSEFIQNVDRCIDLITQSRKSMLSQRFPTDLSEAPSQGQLDMSPSSLGSQKFQECGTERTYFPDTMFEGIFTPNCDKDPKQTSRNDTDSRQPVFISTFVQMVGTNISVTQLPSSSSASNSSGNPSQYTTPTSHVHEQFSPGQPLSSSAEGPPFLSSWNNERGANARHSSTFPEASKRSRIGSKRAFPASPMDPLPKRVSHESHHTKTFHTHRAAEAGKGKDILEELFEMYDLCGDTGGDSVCLDPDMPGYTAGVQASLPRDTGLPQSVCDTEVICISDEEDEI